MLSVFDIKCRLCDIRGGSKWSVCSSVKVVSSLREAAPVPEGVLWGIWPGL